ncbi:amidase [Pontibacillus sp. HMF3514]|uniref:amidase n=1 Tax=Pontibacillus sp. HMF3514 TaxID=2692425 RepID=UPI00131F592C|nr:amidase [Pontibacillus sp. HMF3514]QHE54075.1 amidase [Pontibacillus sp. HMF3514]
MKLLGLFTFLLFGHFSTSDAVMADETKWNQATWLWHTSNIVEAPDEVLQFLNQKDVDSVYLQINRDIDPTSYMSFIKEATNDGISVYALDGSKKWISNREGFDLFLNWVEKYQNFAADEEKFSGIHLDVEPYLHEMWDTDYQNAILQYQNILSEAAQKAKQWDMLFAADIPFWYDTKYFDNETYGKGLLHKWVIDTSDEIGIMAYRNFAEGSNGIVEISNNEIQYAKEVGKKVTIGVETKEITSYDHISFYGLGEEKMNEEVTKVYDQFGSIDSFNGFAIHSYKYWKALGE